ncbi:o-succinylbenzoate--CoA ligase [Dehalobacter sp. DCM]|uniref:o-succinylbenzoate--CoA ligase n=1 Tax=Dehalobacter sp. DCM TaxID=2907827 RepID=UPI0030812499|nr:o-succinylbenzoate--CoA ligase [Dehalobacter sp. DCM]
MNWLEKQALEKPDKRFVNALTFSEVYELTADLAARLSTYVQNQCRVALFSNNSERMILIFLSLQLLQKEVLLLNTRLTETEIEEQCEKLDIRLVIAQNNKTFPSLAAKNGITDARQWLLFDEIFSRYAAKSDPGGDDITISADKVSLAEEFRPEQIAVIMNTSATTGDFKSVPLRWKQFLAHVQASQQCLGMSNQDNWLMVLPMYHISGLTILLRSLYNGTSVTVMERFDEEQTVSLIKNGTVNMLSVVPTMLSRIIDRIQEHHLRLVLTGGEFIPEPLVEKCLNKRIPIYKTYGMTETTSQAVTFSVLEFPEKKAAVGKALPHVKLRISNPDSDGSGEVHIASPMVMDGYLGKEPVKGYFNTEDIGYLDDEGFLYILDRRKNIIISGGENIYPREIESTLYQHPDMVECAVVSRKDPVWGQVPVLFAVTSMDTEAIRQYLGTYLAKYKLPRDIILLTELPRNATGKIARKDLEKMAEDYYRE